VVAKTKTATKTKRVGRQVAKTASRKPKSSNGKATAARHGHTAGEQEVTIERRRGTRREAAAAVAPANSATPTVKLERRQKVNRRRQIDPTTCERDYTDEEVQFMNALDDYKRASGRMFPTCSEVLEVVRSLGYVQLSPTELAVRVASQPVVATVAESSAETDEESAENWQ